MSPFTLSSLQGEMLRGNRIAVLPGQMYRVRVTLPDGGALWDCLSMLLLETGPIEVRPGAIPFKVTRLLWTETAAKFSPQLLDLSL